jgi:ABC-type glycerol-3-phosphate transport system permease component
MAMTLMATIPTLVIFLFAQRYFVQSIVTTGVKG